MALSATVYNSFKLRQANLVDPVDLAGDALALLLCTTAYTPDADADGVVADVPGELASTGNYIRKTLSGQDVAIDAVGDFAYLDAADVVWAALTSSAPFRYAVLFKDTGSDATSPLICWFDLETDQDPPGVDFTIAWPDASSGGVLRFGGPA